MTLLGANQAAHRLAGVRRARAWGLLVLLLSACGAGAPSGPPSTTTTPTRANTAGAELTTASTGSAASAGLPGRAPTPSEWLRLREAFAAAARETGLPWHSEPTVRVMTSQAIGERLAAQLDEEDIVRLKALYVTLGLLPADYDVREAAVTLLSEQVLAFYDPKAKLLVVGEASSADGETQQAHAEQLRLVLLHEAVHALQDQHFDLQQLMAQAQEQSVDAANALRALVEGQAMLVSMRPAIRKALPHADAATHDDTIAQAMGAIFRRWLGSSWRQMEGLPGIARSPALRAAPAIVRTPLLFGYLAGTAYANVGARFGDPPTLAEPPTCTRRVVHLGPCPPPATLPDVSPPPGWRPVLQETLGWLESGVFLAHSLPRDLVDLRWAGDRLQLYEGPAGRHAVRWRLRYETEQDATQAARLAEATLAAAGTEGAVRRKGREVWVAVGWPRTQAEDILRASIDAARGER